MALLLFASIISLHYFLLVESQISGLAPALYVFGDSLSDSGNNNFLRTDATVNFKPYGIDFPSGQPTGRFTNGKTFPDFIAQFLGLPLVPAYLRLSTAEKSRLTTGVNYASGAAGILPETGSATGDVLPFDEQIDFFQTTVTTDLPNIFKTRRALLTYLSKSIFLVNLGNNDYINNYLQPAANYTSSLKYTPQQYAHLLIKGLRSRLKKLYVLGARKFVVFNVARLGCVPAIADMANLPPNTPCAENVNNLVLLYNTKFPGMIVDLERKLPGSTFVRGDSYSMNQTSSEAGFAVPLPVCCGVSLVTGLCLPNSTPCADRTTVAFWDAFHPTEVVNSAQASACFGGSTSCVPINIRQLAQHQ